MTAKSLQVFISSTSDLGEERLALKREIDNKLFGKFKAFLFEEVKANSGATGFVIRVRSENWLRDRWESAGRWLKTRGRPAGGPSPSAPDWYIRKQIDDSEVYVGILGKRYGSLYDPPRDNGSIVKAEYQQSLELSGKRLHLTVVLLKELPDDQIEPEQRRFREEVSRYTDGNRPVRSVWAGKYASVDKLVQEVRDAILFWVVNVVMQIIEEEEEEAGPRERVVKAYAAITVALNVAVSVLYLTKVFTLQPPTLFLIYGLFAVQSLLFITFVTKIMRW